MKHKRHAWLAVEIAIMSGSIVTAAWYVDSINNILGQMQAGNRSADLAQRLDNLDNRVKRGEVKFDTPRDSKLVSYALWKSADALRSEGHFYRDQSVVSRYLLYTALTVFVVQLALAISAFFTRCEVEDKHQTNRPGSISPPSNSG